MNVPWNAGDCIEEQVYYYEVRGIVINCNLHILVIYYHEHSHWNAEQPWSALLSQFLPTAYLHQLLHCLQRPGNLCFFSLSVIPSYALWPLTAVIPSRGYRVCPWLPIQSMTLINLISTPAPTLLIPSKICLGRKVSTVFMIDPSMAAPWSPEKPICNDMHPEREANVMFCPGHCICHKLPGIGGWPLQKVMLAKMSLYCSLPGDELYGLEEHFLISLRAKLGCLGVWSREENTEQSMRVFSKTMYRLKSSLEKQQLRQETPSTPQRRVDS